ncbi:MAG: hypothetical protein ACJ8DC_07735 [Gemmatimonadales bacterium]
MMTNRILLTLTISTGVVASALALGCGDRQGVNDPSTGTIPSFGATVDRFEQPWFERFIDPESGLSLLAGVTLDQLPDICAGGDFVETADWLVVAHPTHDGTVFHVRIRDQNQSVLVWGTAVEQSVCQELFLQGVPPLAVGTARMTFTDNDFAGTSSHADSFGQRIEGTVTNPATGQRYHLEAAYRAVALPGGTFKLPVAPFVRLTQIGG